MNQKIENILNVSLAATKDELRNSDSLNTGFDWKNNTWETIVKYSGSLDSIRSRYNVYIKEMLYNYAIVAADKNTIELISQENNIEYIEKPKSIYYQLEQAKSAACVRNVLSGFNGGNTQYLSGKGVITAVIDTGTDIYNEEFRNADGSTRILNIYDQTIQKEYNADEINVLLGQNGGTRPAEDNAEHGMDVAIIACGKSGVAYESDIIIVKMGYSYNNQLPRTTSLMDAIDYVIRKSMEYDKPVAINISYGSNYGDHRGNTLLEGYINAAALGYKCSICIGSGNEADKAIHYSSVIKNGQTQTAEISIGEYESSIDIQIWKYYWDDIRVVLISPEGVELDIAKQGQMGRYQIGDTDVISLLGEPSPYNLYQEVYINLLPHRDFITPGVWRIQLSGSNIRQGLYNIWLPASEAINSSTGFLKPVSYDTITIPATAQGCISVGAYNSYTGAYAAFSGRGARQESSLMADIKPDILAPGVDISIKKNTRQGIRYNKVTGTSYATPFVTGAAALLMQWGIILGNDRFMYGEKLKACLRAGARPLNSMSRYPDTVSGYGTLCLTDSIRS